MQKLKHVDAFKADEKLVSCICLNLNKFTSRNYEKNGCAETKSFDTSPFPNQATFAHFIDIIFLITEVQEVQHLWDLQVYFLPEDLLTYRKMQMV